jgi:hypothetical protein
MSLSLTLLLLVLCLCACQPAALDTPAPTLETITPLATASPTPEQVSDALPPRVQARLEYTMEGVDLSIVTPRGWEGDIMDGLLMAEHTNSMFEGDPEVGMVVYIFVPPQNEFAVLTGGGGNFAYSVLNHVVQMPNRIGRDTAVSAPVSFRWDDHDAAYYLLTSAEAHTMVLAVAVPDRQAAEAGARPQLVVCNISVPHGRAETLRDRLPRVLNGLTIEGAVMESAALEALPDPLVFPRFSSETASLSTPMQTATALSSQR